MVVVVAMSYKGHASIGLMCYRPMFLECILKAQVPGVSMCSPHYVELLKWVVILWIQMTWRSRFYEDYHQTLHIGNVRLSKLEAYVHHKWPNVILSRPGISHQESLLIMGFMQLSNTSATSNFQQHSIITNVKNVAFVAYRMDFV